MTHYVSKRFDRRMLAWRELFRHYPFAPKETVEGNFVHGGSLRLMRIPGRQAMGN